MLFTGHSLAQPILGTKKTLRHISSSPDRPRAWMAQHYRPERMVVFCQGDIPASRFVKLVEKAFGDFSCSLPPDRTLTFAQEEDHQPQSASYAKHTHQTHVMLGGKAFTLYDERQPGLYLLNNILGGGSLNSRLNLSLREEAGLVYTIESQQNPLSDTGYWNIYFASDDGDREQCIERVRKELRKLREEKLSRYQLDKALRQLYGQMAISAENRENRFLAMGKQMLYYGQAPTWQETFERVSNFTPEALRDIAHEVYDEDAIVTLIYA